MKTFDLTHPITTGMPVFPGTEPPIIEQATTIEKNGFAEKCLRFYSHTGTHLDAPAHILPDGATLNELTIDNYIGQALCISVSKNVIDPDCLKPFITDMASVDFVLFETGWSRYWGEKKYFQGYPVLNEKAAEMLCNFNLKGVGFDTISADREDSEALPVHKILLKKMIIVENLKNLARLKGQQFFFSCLPLKITNGDGSPVRAIAIYGQHE